MRIRILKIMPAALAAVIACAALTGCGVKAEYDENTLVFKNNGSIIQYIVDNDATAKMTEEEIAFFTGSYIGEAVDAYNGSHEDKRIKIDETYAEDSSLRIVLTYPDAAAYSEFNSVNCFSGTVADAAAAGYDLNRTYRSVEGEIVSGQEVRTQLESCYMLVLNEPVRIESSKDLIAVSDGVEIGADGNVRINAATDESLPEEFRTTTLTLSFLIYRN